MMASAKGSIEGFSIKIINLYMSMNHPNYIKSVFPPAWTQMYLTYWYNWIAEDDVATVKDNSSSPRKYTSTGGVESLHPLAPPLPPPPYTEQPSYPVHATGQAIPALLPNGATLPSCQASPSGVDIHQYQTPLNYPGQMFYQGGLVVTGVSGFFCLIYGLTQRTLWRHFFVCI